tara:strand:+ start:604 stop:804 length:201 start_codon:yes stop_codon:yes gene_type:complete
MNLNKIALIFVFILIFNIYFSQPPGLPGNGNGPSCWPPPCVPIDGGISIFTLLSILFGYKLISKNK